MSYTDINSETIDRWIEQGWEWGVPISHEAFLKAKNGEYDMILLPHKFCPHAWIGVVKGKKVLGLAAGGGQQMPVFAALGAECYILDNSKKQIESEEMVAQREGYTIHTIKGDMTKPLPYADGTFDLIFHAISNCYIEEVEPLFKECARILKPHGKLICGFDNVINYIVDFNDQSKINSALPFNPLKNPEQMKSLQDTDSGVQFSHSLEDNIGGMCRAGFVIQDLFEDEGEDDYLRTLHIPLFYATLAEKSR